jgi:hypothetical protein
MTHTYIPLLCTLLLACMLMLFSYEATLMPGFILPPPSVPTVLRGGGGFSVPMPHVAAVDPNNKYKYNKFAGPIASIVLYVYDAANLTIRPKQRPTPAGLPVGYIHMTGSHMQGENECKHSSHRSCLGQTAQTAQVQRGGTGGKKATGARVGERG